MARRVGIVAALAAAISAFIVVAVELHGMFDLSVYYGALNFWVNDGGQLYDYLTPGTRYGFTYPPFAALAMLPMAAVDWHPAIAISVTLTVAATALVMWWLVGPVARRHGWPPWFAFAVAVCLAAAFEPIRETVTFGQVNMLLMLLVTADVVFLVARRSPLAGVGIGLATAIKLTPAIFIAYLLITGRRRAAAVAGGTAAAATLLAGVAAPTESRIFWTEALWNTDRVGVLSIISNQSLYGMVARLHPEHPDRLLWGVLAVAALAVWVYRARLAVAAGDEVAGFALTGVAGCLLSPVSWVHHLVWLMPSLVVLVDASARSRRRRWLLGFAIGAYALLASRLIWVWSHGGGLPAFLGGNAYLWVGVALLVLQPIRSAAAGRQPDGVPDLDEIGRRPAVRPLDPERGPLPVGD